MFGKDFREDAASAQNVAAMLQIEDEVYVDLRPRERQMGPSSLRRTSWAGSWMARILLLASLSTGSEGLIDKNGHAFACTKLSRRLG